MFKKTILATLIGMAFYFSEAQQYTISGYVKDADSGEDLIGATVYDKTTKKGIIANLYGFYSLTLPAGEHTLTVQYVGFSPMEKTINLTENQTINFSLKSETQLEEVVVTAKEEIEEVPQMSSIDVPIEQIKSMPVLLGEADVLKSLQLLPGIQGGTEGSSGIYVRGGGPDQNLILLDGVPVYNVSHLFGFFSVFNPDAINKVNAIKGGFPARYGGRLSSVIDIRMKEGNKKKFSGEGSIGLLSSKLTLEGPLGRNKKTSFIVSARRTYLDILVKPIIKAQSDGESSFGYYFYDVNAKVNHEFSQKDRLYVSIYNGLDKGGGRNVSKGESQDKTEFEEHIQSPELKWGNTIAALRWNHVFSPKLFGNLTATYSRYKFLIGGKNEDKKYKLVNGDKKLVEDNFFSFNYSSVIRDYAAKLDFDYLPSVNHSIKFGANVIQHTFVPGVTQVKVKQGKTENKPIKAGAEETPSVEYALYAEDDITLTGKLRANFGLHYSGNFVEKTLFHYLQPRVSLRYLLGKDLSLKGSFVTMGQYIHLLTNAGLGLPTDLWVPATKKIGMQKSWQAALGAAKSFNGYEVSTELYYKEMNGMVEYKEGATFLNTTSDWQDKVVIGKGESYGMELLIQKKIGRLSGWLGYTLSWSNRIFKDLNFGKRFPYKYDRRHDISIVASYKVNDKLSLSSTWVYGTGNAVSIPYSTYQGQVNNNGYISTQTIKHYKKRNDFRMRSYHRMDIGATWTKQKRWGERKFSLGAYNAYSRKNPFYMDIETVKNQKKLVDYAMFPIVPYIKYQFKF